MRRRSADARGPGHDQTTLDAEGRAKVDGFGPDAVLDLAVKRLPGHADATFRVPVAGRSAVTLRLPASGPVVRVLGPTGAPIAGARVAGNVDDDRWWVDGESDRDGRARFQGERLRKLVVEADGHAREEVERALGPGEALDVVLRPVPRSTCVLRGTVVDEGGRPLAGTQVGGAELGGETRHDGTFVLRGLPPGHVKLSAERGDRGRAVLTVELASGEERRDLVLMLDRGARLAGRAPGLAGGLVCTRWAGEQAPADVARPVGHCERVREDGTFDLGVHQPGRWVVTAEPRGGEVVATVEVELRPGEERTDLVLAPDVDDGPR